LSDQEDVSMCLLELSNQLHCEVWAMGIRTAHTCPQHQAVALPFVLNPATSIV